MLLYTSCTRGKQIRLFVFVQNETLYFYISYINTLRYGHVELRILSPSFFYIHYNSDTSYAAVMSLGTRGLNDTVVLRDQFAWGLQMTQGWVKPLFLEFSPKYLLNGMVQITTNHLQIA